MVTRYDVISWRWSSLSVFEWKCMSFQLLSTIKVKLVDQMMQNAYSCVILHVKHKKLPFVAILTWFLWFLVKSKMANKMATFVGDLTGLQQSHYIPIKYTSSCWEDQRCSTDGKIASKYYNNSKTLGRGCTCKRTQQLPTLIFMTQQCWDLLRPFACSLVQHWVSFTGENNRFLFLDILGYLKNTHKNPKFGKARQVPTREFPIKFPGWDLSQSSKFGIFVGIL